MTGSIQGGLLKFRGLVGTAGTGYKPYTLNPIFIDPFLDSPPVSNSKRTEVQFSLESLKLHAAETQAPQKRHKPQRLDPAGVRLGLRVWVLSTLLLLLLLLSRVAISVNPWTQMFARDTRSKLSKTKVGKMAGRRVGPHSIYYSPCRDSISKAYPDPNLTMFLPLECSRSFPEAS